MKRLDQSGSHIVAVAVGVLVLGVIAFAGYTVSQRGANKTVDSTAKATTSTQASTISNNADLTKAAAQLDSSSSQVDSSLNDSSLDADLNDLL